MKKLNVAIVGLILVALFVAGLLNMPKSSSFDVKASEKTLQEELKYHRLEALKKLSLEKNAELAKAPIDSAITDTVAKIGLLRFLGDTLNPEHRNKMKRYLGAVFGIKDPADQETIISKAEAFTTQSKSLETEKFTSLKTNRTRASKLKVDNERLAVAAYNEIRSSLSEQGRDNLAVAFATRVKRKIKAYRGN